MKDIVLQRIKKIVAPFEVVKNEIAYILWPIAIFVFAPLSAWIKLIHSNEIGVVGTFTHEFTLTLCLSLLIPSIADYFIETFVLWRRTKQAPFFGYLIFLTIPCAFLLVAETIYFCLADTTCHLGNLVVALFTIAISTYVYCAGKMLSFPEMKKYKTNFYLERDKEKRRKIETEAVNKKKVNVGGKEIPV